MRKFLALALRWRLAGLGGPSGAAQSQGAALVRISSALFACASRVAVALEHLAEIGLEPELAEKV